MENYTYEFFLNDLLFLLDFFVLLPPRHVPSLVQVRVQRIPVTESGGRIHTSTATVAIMPEAEEVDVDLDLNDCRFDVFRSSGILINSAANKAASSPPAPALISTTTFFSSFEYDYEHIQIKKDYAGLDRIIYAKSKN